MAEVGLSDRLRSRLQVVSPLSAFEVLTAKFTNISTMDSLSNNNGHRTSHYIAGAALVAGVAFLLSRRTPATPVKLEWKWDRKTDYSGLLIAEVLHAHGVRFVLRLILVPVVSSW